MKDGYLRVGCANYEVSLGNVPYNAQHIIQQTQQASQQNIKVLVFPELCLTGCTLEDLFYQKRLLHEVTHHIDIICQQTKDEPTLIVYGAPLIHKNKLYNCAIVSYQGKILGVIPKSYLPCTHDSYQSRHFQTLDEDTMISINNHAYPFGTDILFEDQNHPSIKLGVEIADELWAPLAPSTYHCLNGATVILNLGATPALATKAEFKRQFIAMHSARLNCAYVYSEAGVGESTTDVVYSNQHLIYENGQLLKEGTQYASQIIFADIDCEALISDRIENSLFEERNDHYQCIPFTFEDESLDLTRTYSPLPFIPTDEKEREERCKEVFDIQIHALMQRLKAAHIRKVVIGISGGLDSTLALLVASAAYKKLGYPSTDIIAVTMPCFGTTSRTKNNALTMMEELHVTSKTVTIADAVLQHFKDIDHDVNVHDVTYENAQARERTQVIMDIANQEGGIVVGTGDLSEVALGWSTYNGDHMSMYGVNASIPKTLVRHIVHYVSTLYKGEPLETVLLDILDTPVSPELLPAKDNQIVQKTEDIVGPYELHDFFLYHHARFHDEPSKLYRKACLAFKDQYQPEIIKKWLQLFYRRFFTQQFKRSCIPDGPKVGSVALSPRGDLRMPSDANVKIWLDACENL